MSLKLKMKLRGIVETAGLFPDTNRDLLYAYVTRGGCPDASVRVGNRRAFTEEDIERIRRWFQSTGRKVYPLDYQNELMNPQPKPRRRGGVLAGAAM